MIVEPTESVKQSIIRLLRSTQSFSINPLNYEVPITHVLEHCGENGIFLDIYKTGFHLDAFSVFYIIGNNVFVYCCYSENGFLFRKMLKNIAMSIEDSGYIVFLSDAKNENNNHLYSKFCVMIETIPDSIGNTFFKYATTPKRVRDKFFIKG